jgi:hypothetical protein
MLSQSSKIFIHSHTQDSTTGTLLPNPENQPQKNKFLLTEKEPNHTRKSWNEKTQLKLHNSVQRERTKTSFFFFFLSQELFGVHFSDVFV